ncbi:hypothetical protein ACGVWS_08140 [Enterobacteriaceae bacterium LUAb1]
MNENKAALIIQHAYRKYIADKTRYDMTKRGYTWRNDSDGLLIKTIEENSTYLNQERQSLNAKETLFLERFMRTKFYATHATNAHVIDEKKRLVLYSYRKLKENGVKPVSHQDTSNDIYILGNDDYVFFSLEAGESLQKKSSRFGNVIYRIDFKNFNFKHADLLLVDQQLAWSNNNLDMHFNVQAPVIHDFRMNYNEYLVHLTNNTTSILQKMAMNLILINRHVCELQYPTILTINSDNDVNTLINSVFRPEIRVPRMAIFLNGEYQKYKI